MNPAVKVYKKLKIKIFNKRNETIIRSLYASLNARYGKNVRIDEGTYVSGDVTIGDQSYINANSRLQHCDVGKYCSISSNVNINPYNHNMKGLTTHPIGDVPRQIERVVIGNDVLISLNVTIMEGVHIADGAVIGAGAVVTHDVGKYEIWGGVPAKFIRYRVPDEKQRDALIQLEWWNLKTEDQLLLIEKYKTQLDGLEEQYKEHSDMDISKVTIFTPTYNRDKYITNLYESLCKQTILPCEWIIIDQGNDETKELANGFIERAKFPIIYKRIDGERGIGRALNLMMGIANGNLVMKVDDDDTLTADAIETVLKVEETIKDKDSYAGVGGLRQYPDKRAIGSEWTHSTDYFDCTNLERAKNGLSGDKAEAYYLHVLKEFGPIPTIPGEYFTWEGILWDRIAHAGKKIRWFNRKIYCTQYLPGGATNTRVEARKNNFYTYTIFVSERLAYPEVPFKERLILSCRYFELMREKGLSYRDLKQYFSKTKGFAMLGRFGSMLTKYIPQHNVDYNS